MICEAQTTEFLAKNQTVTSVYHYLSENLTLRERSKHMDRTDFQCVLTKLFPTESERESGGLSTAKRIEEYITTIRGGNTALTVERCCDTLGGKSYLQIEYNSTPQAGSSSPPFYLLPSSSFLQANDRGSSVQDAHDRYVGQGLSVPQLAPPAYRVNAGLVCYLFDRLALERPTIRCRVVCLVPLYDDASSNAVYVQRQIRKLEVEEGVNKADALILDTWGKPKLEDFGLLHWKILVKPIKYKGVSLSEVAQSVFTALKTCFYSYICPSYPACNSEFDCRLDSSFNVTPLYGEIPNNTLEPCDYSLQGRILIRPKYNVATVKTELENYFCEIKRNPDLFQRLCKLGDSYRPSVKLDEYSLNFEIGDQLWHCIICKKDDQFTPLVTKSFEYAGCQTEPISWCPTSSAVPDFNITRHGKVEMVGFALPSVQQHSGDDSENLFLNSLDKSYRILRNIILLESERCGTVSPSSASPVLTPDDSIQEGRITTYPDLMGQPSWKDFVIPSEGLSEETRLHKLKRNRDFLQQQCQRLLGYQMNTNFAPLSDEMIDCFKVPGNNVGDPFQPGNLTLNTKHLEINVLNYFAKLWGIQHFRDPANPPPHPESYWGYILTMGATEANMYALFNARDYLSGVSLINAQRVPPRKSERHREFKMPVVNQFSLAQPAFSAQMSMRPREPLAPHDPSFTPVAFFSEDTHYSIIKTLRSMSIFSCMELGKMMHSKKKHRAWWRCPISDNGEWPDVPTVEATGMWDKRTRNHQRGSPFGTVECGYDPVDTLLPQIRQVLAETKMEKRVMWPKGSKREQRHMEIRDGYWIHVDAALGGSYVPFLRQRGYQLPQFDFSLPMVHSISTSSHKFIGSPFPGGIYMTKAKYQIIPPSDPQYIGSPDTTFAGSRSALTPLFMWNALASTSQFELANRAERCVQLTHYFVDQLRQLEKKNAGRNPPQAEHPSDLWIIHHGCSLAVCFRAPHRDTTFKYSLSGETLDEPGVDYDGTRKMMFRRTWNHVYVMPSVTKLMIDNLLADLDSHGFALDSEMAVI
ncbi:histidine decarboxylase [Pelomyxa schiedti]|nr:histidine decarboxylase [Pelomyxa schiedti]